MLAHSLIPQFLAHVRRTHWKVALRIDVEGANRLIDRVRSRDLDAAIVQIEPYFYKEGLKQITLFEDKRAYYAGERHPLAGKKSVTLKNIARSQHIIVGAFSGQRHAPLENSTANVGNGPMIELSGDVAIALHLLTTGTYIAALPEFVMEHLCDERRFIRLAYHGEMPSRTLSIWYREDMGGHPLIKDFCRRLVRYISALRAKTIDDARSQALTKPAHAKRQT